MGRITTCDYCGEEYEISPSSWSRHKKHGKNKYCSRKCSILASGRNYGGYKCKCKTCGKEIIASYPDKKYCSMDCYMSDEKTMDRLKSYNDKKHEEGSVDKECKNCGKEITVRKSRIGFSGNSFCSRSCYREYLSERFDRFIESNVSFENINNFDEFLTEDELSCPIDGCGWFGKHLGNHLNLSHGILSRDAKMAMGFNLSTGLCTRDVSEKLSNTAIETQNKYDLCPPEYDRNFAKNKYISKERIDHAKKSIAISISNGTNKVAKLKISQVKEIKKLLKDETFSVKEIAEAYNVTLTTIYYIRRGKTWKNVPSA